MHLGVQAALGAVFGYACDRCSNLVQKTLVVGQLLNKLLQSILEAARAPPDQYGFQRTRAHARLFAVLECIIELELEPVDQLGLARSRVALDDEQSLCLRRTEQFIKKVLLHDR